MTPIQQMEYLGADVFVGNPALKMSEVENFDLRLDWTPETGTFASFSCFHKKITDPIEYVQRVGSNIVFTTAVNYPEGALSGYEMEFRQDVGVLNEKFKGLSLGFNATFIDSEVTLPEDEAEGFNAPNIQAPMSTNDMSNAPEYLYNIYLTQEFVNTGTTLSLFYTVQGDTLLAGAGVSKGNFVPNVYAKEYGTLNFTLSQKIKEHCTLSLKVKNILNPDIETVYRSEYVPGSDKLKTSYSKGIEFSLSLKAEF